MNYYGSPEHNARLQDWEKRIFSKCVFLEPTSEYRPNEKYLVKRWFLSDESTRRSDRSPDCGNFNRLYRNDTFLFEWRYIGTEERDAQIIHHANGKDYLVYYEYLYGYSVLDLTTMKGVHYIPQESVSFDDEHFDETFIWCQPYYDPASSLLAVDGCIWAAPYSVIVLDFSDPMKIKEASHWIDLSGDVNSDIYDETEFSSWEHDTLVCSVYRDEKKEPRQFTKEDLMKKLSALDNIRTI